MARSAHRLNLLAAFFFPIATLSAVFGVNLIHGWESESAPIPFLAMLALGLMLGCVLTLFVTNRPPEPARKRTDRDRPQEDGPRTPYRRAETSAESGRRLAGR
jgi:hypothetical protein